MGVWDWRLEQHYTALEKLEAEAREKIAQHDCFEQIARQVDELFALNDLESGRCAILCWEPLACKP